MKDVRICGSAVSLVLGIVYFDGLEDKIVDGKTGLFWSSPMILDSHYFLGELENKKWNRLDKHIFDKLNHHAEGGITKAYFDELWRLKTDEELNIALGWPALA